MQEIPEIVNSIKLVSKLTGLTIFYNNSYFFRMTCNRIDDKAL